MMKTINVPILIVASFIEPLVKELPMEYAESPKLWRRGKLVNGR